MKRLALIISMALWHLSAQAKDCFSIPVENPFSLKMATEVWCREIQPEGTIYWRPDVKPLPFLHLKDGSWVYSSLVRGEWLTVRTKDLDVVPLNIKEQLPILDQFSRIKVVDGRQTQWNVLALAAQAQWVRTSRIAEGTVTAHVSDERMPFAGYWWPYRSLELASGYYSPLGKFDRWHEANLGQSNRAAQWEIDNHNLIDLEWGGHCNGWAASSILYQEPQGAVADPVSKIVFLASDLKGLMASTSFCVNWAFYGKRYRQTGDDLRDISPDRFHKILEHYIVKLNKPLAFDYVQDEIVDNNIIVGYTMTTTKVAENTYQVSVQVQAVDYQHNRSEIFGAVNSRNFYYSYQLHTDVNGEILSGEWLSSDNPDFLWAPINQANCGRENPFVDYRKVEKILMLPQVSQQVLMVNQELEVNLAPAQRMNVLENVIWPEGPQGQLTYDLTPGTVSGLRLDIEQSTLYPNRDERQRQTTHSLYPGLQSISFQGIRPERLQLWNASSQPVHIKIKFQNYTWMGIQ